MQDYTMPADAAELNESEQDENAIAIIGMACHLPGARNLDEYWHNLRNGVESVRFFSDEELLEAGETPERLAHPNYVRAQPWLEHYDRFDADFWGFSPQDAAVTDPAHRIFLEVAYQALEHAGQTADDTQGRVGVFATSSENLYRMKNLNTHPSLIDDMGEFLVRHTGNDMNFLATRVSYELDLRGPSMNIQTACSSSLVAVHTAVQSLLSGECDSALVGGTTVIVPQKRGYIYREGEILSPDGHCRPFDAQSAGTLFGSGAGAIVLKRLEDAVADGDTIHAVIQGSAVNNDGSQKVSYLAPSVDGQAGAIAEALSISGIDAGDISYIETHGTGTQLGDPIEFEALNQVFRDATSKRDFCRIGSVKSNIGHLGEAAGIAAIIKVVLAMKAGELPPTLNYQSPNPQLDLQDSPFIINQQLQQWQCEGERVAGVTSLGAGGTNASVLLRQAPELAPGEPSPRAQELILLSAKTESALTLAQRNLAQALEQCDVALADVAYTLQMGRRAYPYRAALASRDVDEAVRQLNQAQLGQAASQVRLGKALEQTPEVVFMFPGGGAQYPTMGRALYQQAGVYRDSFDACLACLEPSLGEQIRQLVLSDDSQANNLAEQQIQQPALGLPALFACEYALAQQFMAWGVKPSAMIGHSMGENTAACLAGVMSLVDAMGLVALRGQLFEQTASQGLGAMLSIALSVEQAQPYLTQELDIAAINSQALCVASGPVAQIETLAETLTAQDIENARVRINVAAHSRMLEPILEAFRAYLKGIALHPPTIPFTSNLSGSWITDSQAQDPEYWVAHLRNSVRFADNLQCLQARGSSLLLEVGPGATLGQLAQANLGTEQLTISGLPKASQADDAANFALASLGQLWVCGLELDTQAYWGEEARLKIPLPSYPFEQKRYLIEPGVVQVQAEPASTQLLKRADQDSWYSLYNWQQVALPIQKNLSQSRYLVFADQYGFAQALVDKLSQQGLLEQVIWLEQGEQFAQLCEDRYQLNPRSQLDFEALTEQLGSLLFSQCLYCWLYAPSDVSDLSVHAQLSGLEMQQSSSFWGLFNLSKLLGETEQAVRLTVIASDVYSLGDSAGSAAKSLLQGPVAVIPHEYPQHSSQAIDLPYSAAQSWQREQTLEQVISELQAQSVDLSERFICYRAKQRYGRQFVPAPVAAAQEQWLRDGARVLITGGLGGIGLTIAKELARAGAKSVVLLSRSTLPLRQDWPSYLAEHHESDLQLQRIEAIQAIEALGCDVQLLQGDICDVAQVEAVLALAGKLHGVVHAAGHMDDELSLLKTAASAERVLAAKVKGALILDRLLGEQTLDFFVVFSSIASHLGLPGQIDYTAANAYLDEFVQQRSQRAPGISLAINWNIWANIGMAAQASQNLAAHWPRRKPSAGIWDYQAQVSADESYYVLSLSTEHWLLSEHQTKQGEYVIPGTGYIELMRNAAAQTLGGQQLRLDNVQFLSVFQLELGQEQNLYLQLEHFEGQLNLSIFSKDQELPHATATASALPDVTPDRLAITELQMRCPQTQALQGRQPIQHFMNFGPRWACLDTVKLGEQEALLSLRLAPEFEADLSAFGLHPAVMDMATGAAQNLMPGFDPQSDFYVPFGYAQLDCFGVMPAQLHSYVKAKPGQGLDGFYYFDIELANKQGEVFARIDDFCMKKMDSGFAKQDASHSHAQENLQAILAQGILADEGARAFAQVLACGAYSQCIVSSVDSQQWALNLERVDDTPFEPSLSFVHEASHDPDADSDIPEIEACLLAHASIEQVVVRAFQDESERRRIIAFYQGDDWEPATVTELRQYAQAELESVLVPQHFVELDELPRTDSGELERNGLLDPFAPVDNYVAPQTPSQKQLGKIWQAALGVERISTTDNFFDVGGHSLLAIRVMMKVKKHFGVRLDQAQLAMMTLEQMAAVIDQAALNSAQPAEAQPVMQTPAPSSGPDNKVNASSTSDNPVQKTGLFKSIFKRGK